MYSSGYSQVTKPSLQAQKKMQYRSKGKSCGYYMRIVFFFSSLIQSLIIVSLVLFLIYGKKQDSVSMSRIQDLEESFSRLSIENVALRHQRKNLTTLLNSTLTEKARNDWDLARLRYLANISVLFIQEMEKNLQQCSAELSMCRSSRLFSGQCQTISNCNCGLPVESLRAKLELVESNFTQTTQRMSMEMDQIAKERDSLNLEAIRLRREKSTHDKEVEFCRQKCKDDFAQSLTGISTVTQNFLNKVESLFPAHIAFQLTCTKQREHLEQIRTNCTSLSREVEDRFQRYLNSVGEQVSNIQSENSRLKAENWRLSEDYRWCSMNRTGLIQQHKKNLEKLQQEYDEFKERLLLEKMRHLGQIEVLQNTVKYKTKECDHLTEQLRQLNMSCAPRTGFGGNPGGSILRPGTSQTGLGSYGGGGSSSVSSSFSQGGQFPRTASGLSFGSAGSAYNKPVSTGAGSSSSSTYSAGSNSFTGLGSNKPVSTGAGSSSSSTYSAGSSSFTGLGSNKPVSTGPGSSSSSTFSAGSSSSTGLGSNKPVSTGGAVSSYGSVGLNPSLSLGGTGSNKPALPGRGSSTTGSSSVSTGSIPNFSSGGIGSNKPTTNVKPSGVGPSSLGLSWFGFGSSNSGQSKPGSGTGRGTSGGTGYGGTGSSSGAGRTSGLGGGSVSITQHLQDLHRLINPSGPEEKQDLSKILG